MTYGHLAQAGGLGRNHRRITPIIAETRSANPAIRRILVCASSINDINANGVEVLQALNNYSNGASLELYSAAVEHQVARILDKADMLDELGRERILRRTGERLGA